MSMYSYCMFMYLKRASWHSSATLTEVLPCFFLSCKANARVKPAKMVQGPHNAKMFVLFYVFFVSSCVLFVCKSVLYYGHRVPTQLQLTNIAYHITSNSEYQTCPVCVNNFGRSTRKVLFIRPEANLSSFPRLK
jgi:hypothetical protein